MTLSSLFSSFFVQMYASHLRLDRSDVLTPTLGRVNLDLPSLRPPPQFVSYTFALISILSAYTKLSTLALDHGVFTSLYHLMKGFTGKNEEKELVAPRTLRSHSSKIHYGRTLSYSSNGRGSMCGLLQRRSEKPDFAKYYYDEFPPVRVTEICARTVTRV